MIRKDNGDLLFFAYAIRSSAAYFDALLLGIGINVSFIVVASDVIIRRHGSFVIMTE